jgi:hypothetical protein
LELPAGRLGPPAGRFGPPDGRLGPPVGLLELPAGRFGLLAGRLKPPVGRLGLLVGLLELLAGLLGVLLGLVGVFAGLFGMSAGLGVVDAGDCASLAGAGRAGAPGRGAGRAFPFGVDLRTGLELELVVGLSFRGASCLMSLLFSAIITPFIPISDSTVSDTKSNQELAKNNLVRTIHQGKGKEKQDGGSLLETGPSRTRGGGAHDSCAGNKSMDAL